MRIDAYRLCCGAKILSEPPEKAADFIVAFEDIRKLLGNYAYVFVELKRPTKNATTNFLKSEHFAPLVITKTHKLYVRMKGVEVEQ